jgi:ABC-2 type transport system ATP-binding protein
MTMREGRASANSKKAALLTTHYIYEADEICDRIGTLSRGRLLKVDTPRRLKQSISHETSLKAELRQAEANLDWLGGVNGVGGFSAKSVDGGTSVRVVLKVEEHVADILSAFKDRGIDVASFSKTEPTLEDVYVAYVGGELENG